MAVQITPVTTGIPPQSVTQILIRINSFNTDATSTDLFFDAQTSGGTSVDQGNLLLSGATFNSFIYATGSTSVIDIEDYALSQLGLSRL